MPTSPSYFPPKWSVEIELRAINWSSALPVGDTISTSNWACEPAGITIGSTSIVGAQTTCRLSGGTAGVTYQLTNTIVTAQGLQLFESVSQQVI